MAEKFQYNELWSRPQAQGGTRLGFLGPPINPQRRRRLTNDDMYSFGLLKTHRHAALIEKGTCIREILSLDGTSWREWPIEHYTRGSGDNPLVVIDCIPMFHLLVKYPVQAVDADGYVYTETGALSLTPTQITGTYIRSTTPTWISTGIVTPAGIIDLPFSRDSSASGLRRMEDVTGYESQLRPNGTSQYLIDHLRIGGTAPPLYLRTGKNIRSLTKETVPGQVTRLTTITGADGDDGPAGIAWAYYEVVSLAASVVTLTSIHGGDGPIAFDHQCVDRSVTNLVPMDFLDWSTSGTTQLTSNFLSTGDYALDRIGDNSAANAAYFFRALAFTGNAVKVVSLVIEKDAASPGNPVVQLRDTTAGADRLLATITWAGTVPSVAMTTGSLLGTDDLGGGLYRVRFQTTSVTAANAQEIRVYPAGTTIANVGQLDAYYCLVENAAACSPLPMHLWWERMDGTITEVTGSNAVAETITVGSGTNIAAGHWGRFLATRAGKQLTWLNAPVQEALYDLQPGEFTSGWDDTVCILKNPLGAAWGTPGSRPDGWSGVGSQTILATEVVTAGKALSINQSVTDGVVIASPAARTWRIRNRKTQWSALALIRLRAATAVGDITFQVKANGTPIGKPLIYQSPLNAWKPLLIEGIDLSAYLGTSPSLVAEIIKSNGTGTVNMIVDCICLFPSIARRAPLEGSGSARIAQDANRYLAARAPLQVRMAADAVDLAAMGVAGQPDVVLGQTVITQDDEFGALTLRVMEVADVPGQPGQEHYEISSLPPQFSREQSRPAELVIPFFDPIAVRVADRDTRNAALLLKVKTPFTQTSTQITINLDVLDTLGGAPVVTAVAFGGASIASGSGAGPWVINRPTAGAGMGRVVWTAVLPGRSDATDAADIPEQPATLVYSQCLAAVSAVTATTVSITVTATSTLGTPTVQLVAVTGSAVLFSGPAIGVPSASGTVWVFTRGAFAAGVGQVQFRAVLAGTQSDDDFVDIAEVGRDTVTLTARARVTTTSPTQVIVRVAVADPYPQGANSATIGYQKLPTGLTVTPATGQTVTPAATLTEAAGTFVDFTITRPVYRTGTARVTFTVDAANRLSDTDAVDIPDQDYFDPLYKVQQTTETDTTVLITLVVTDDPQSNISSVQWATQTGQAAVSAYGTAQTAPGPYSTTVTLVEGQTSKVFYRINLVISTGAGGAVEGFVTVKDAATPTAPKMTLSMDSTGIVTARIEGDILTASLRFASSLSAMPADATVDAATPSNNRQLTTGTLQTVTTASPTCYVKAVAYSATSGGGAKSVYVQGTLTYTKTVTKTLRVHGASLVPEYEGTKWTFDSIGAINNNVINTTQHAFGAFAVPAGATITTVRMRGYRNGTGDTCIVEFYRVESDSQTVLATLTHNSTSWQTKSASISESASAGRSYFFLAAFAGSTILFARCQWVELDYTTPSYEVTY